MKRILSLFFLLTTLGIGFSSAQTFIVEGRIVEQRSGKSVEFASVLLKEEGLWAITNENGVFRIKNVPAGKTTLTVQCLGYQKIIMPITIGRNITNMVLKLKEEDLRLEEVTVVAKRKTDEATTSYTIDRTSLDNQQILNIGDISTLLPGGKSTNPTLMNDGRMALRSSSQEKGNASFGTAIEVDGVRLDNNSAAGETMAASTRTISTSNIESIEIVTGIPSVEYGDLSNGVVKVNTRKGKSPFIVEGKLNQHTQQFALNKGFDLGHHWGVLNTSFEHARSASDIASPHTAYQRNILSLNYSNTLLRESSPMTFNIGITGNIGGYNAEVDPDRNLDSYAKAKDNQLRAHVELNWLLNKPWITNLQLKGSLSYTNKRSESYTNQSSASSQPYIHSMEEGYFIAQDYDSKTNANIILGPTGYWYLKGFNDSKPLTYSLKAKAEWNKTFKTIRNKVLLGAELTGSQNNGRGTYYDDMRYAPTWREYRYDELPAMNNLALYVEDKVIWDKIELTAGLREDITFIKGSDYGTVSSFSPRFNGRYIFLRNNRKGFIREFNIHAGWGKSVKLPSFQVLYPSPSYADRLAFAPGSTADNKAFYAYHTYPSKAIYNPDLRWQYTNQTDLGFEINIKGTRIMVSAFHHKTNRSYMGISQYTPFAYKFTGQAALEQSGIASQNRVYSVDRHSGIVTVTDLTGAKQPVQLNYNERKTFLTNTQYVNASPVNRYGLEWIVDFAQIKALKTSLRIDGNSYYYKGIDDMLFADIPLGTSSTMTNGQLYGYIGFYRGANATSAGYTASASVSNGALSKQVNLNATITTHIPKLRMIVALRIESSLYNYRRLLSEFDDASRAIVLESNSDYFGTPYDGSSHDKIIAVYPEYYSTWENPTELIPFAEELVWARDHDQTLYNDLTKLVVRSNFPYTMNPNKISSYYSANISVTKEIGDHISLSFYANNFFNNMKTVKSSQTDLETSLFASGYIPNYYYGLSLRLKI